MYRPPSSSASTSSSSSQQQQSSISQTGLTRYGSAPGSLLTSTVDAVLGGSRLLPGTGHYFSGDSSHLQPQQQQPQQQQHQQQRSSYEGFDGSSLVRQKSSPAGFLNHLATLNHNNSAGFTITRGGNGGSRLKSELSFTGGGQGQECLSRISENGVDYAAVAAGNGSLHNSNWSGGPDSNNNNNNNNSNSIVFSSSVSQNQTNNKRSSRNDDDPDLLLHCLNALESQYSLPQTSMEMDKLMHIPQDSVPCKIRAKRGCATHPRSIAERERRTRISGKLKKLQDLVPNMDKQTSYSDMLDLAVQHIKGLQTQVQKLHEDLENCTCGCKQNT
ncbi:unnamed protein product [Lathyrus sativus]|nr:unnamed protein product [Lathyrus sativus]